MSTKARTCHTSTAPFTSDTISAMYNLLCMAKPIVFELRRVSKSYRNGRKEKTVLSDVTLEISKGDALAIVGESGSGKTTLAQILCGLIEPTSGVISFNGTTSNLARAIRGQVQLILQDPRDSFDPRWTIGKSILEPLQERHAPEEREKLLLEAVRQVDLPIQVCSRLPKELSGGQLQRASIARALLTDPQVVVADEPLSSLDLISKAQIVELIRSNVVSKGSTLVLVSHDLSAVRTLTKHIAVLWKGELVEYGDTDYVFENPSHHYTKKLLKSTNVQR